MPEGPEIRIAADRVAKVLLDQPLLQVHFGLQSLKRFERRLSGRVVTAVDTHGKAMLTRFDNGLTLYSHNQLYGRWYVVERPSMPDTSRQLRVALHTAAHSALLYSASEIAVLTPRQLERHPFLKRVGPDILDPALTAEDIAARLGENRFRKRALGSLYLDQSYLAGNGNYLRSEILWAAGVGPSKKPAELDSAARRKLARETLKISQRSYRTRGITVAPGLLRVLKSGGLGYGDYRFNVFGRAGLPCHRCSTAITRSTSGGRNIFYCASCQAV